LVSIRAAAPGAGEGIGGHKGSRWVGAGSDRHKVGACRQQPPTIKRAWLNEA